jgi:hypothetical protein
MWRASIVVILLLEQCASTLATVGTAAALFLRDRSEMRMVLFVVVLFLKSVGLCLLFGLTEVYAFLFGMMGFI